MIILVMHVSVHLLRVIFHASLFYSHITSLGAYSSTEALVVL